MIRSWVLGNEAHENRNGVLLFYICVCEKLWWIYILQKGSDGMSELYHYGVKGMKWGVRKEVYNSSSRSRKKEIRKEYYKTPRRTN